MCKEAIAIGGSNLVQTYRSATLLPPIPTFTDTSCCVVIERVASVQPLVYFFDAAIFFDSFNNLVWCCGEAVFRDFEVSFVSMWSLFGST